MDKRRAVSRNPRNPRTIHTPEEAMTGNPALDGYSVRHREPMTRTGSPYYEKPALGSDLMDETEARFRAMFSNKD